MSRVNLFTVVVLAAICFVAANDDDKIYKMCVPHIFLRDCQYLLREQSQVGIKMQCVVGRDRMDCLEKVNRREADIIAVDPEDMYVAYHMNNQDFKVISEIRTETDRDADFRYEGIILVKKDSNIRNLQDLRGKRSCHTGFGRNVGYKIPVTKLKKHGLLHVSNDQSLSSTERELKALSEFFSQSCIVGTYSPHNDVDDNLKRRYSNLCALCENPQQCNYPDKYSGYEGAIRCLVEGQGQVAFTKTSFVKKYFGLISGTTQQGNAHDYEYLCEDGTRKPITGQACSWAQRPWQGYMTHTDVVRDQNKLKNLQRRIDTFFNNAKQTTNKEFAAHLFIKDDLLLHEKQHTINPKEYLERAGYKDVIERDGSMTMKIKLCVTTDIEMKKCDILKKAAYSRDIRPEFECVLHSKDQCVQNIKQGTVDAIVLRGEDYKHGRNNNLKPVIFESYDDDDVIVAVVDADVNHDVLRNTNINFNTNCKKSQHAAQFLNKIRGKSTCVGDLQTGQNGHITLVRAKDLKRHLNINDNNNRNKFNNNDNYNFFNDYNRNNRNNDNMNTNYRNNRDARDNYHNNNNNKNYNDNNDNFNTNYRDNDRYNMNNDRYNMNNDRYNMNNDFTNDGNNRNFDNVNRNMRRNINRNNQNVGYDNLNDWTNDNLNDQYGGNTMNRNNRNNDWTTDDFNNQFGGNTMNRNIRHNNNDFGNVNVNKRDNDLDDQNVNNPLDINSGENHNDLNNNNNDIWNNDRNNVNLNINNLQNKKLLCKDMQKKDLQDYNTCNMDATLPNAVFVRDNLNNNDLNNIVHAFISLTQKFGHTGNLEDVFEIFDKFQQGHRDVIFNDNTVEFVTDLRTNNGITENTFNELQCN